MTTRELTDATSEFAAPTGAELYADILEALKEIHAQVRRGYVYPAHLYESAGQGL